MKYTILLLLLASACNCDPLVELHPYCEPNADCAPGGDLGAQYYRAPCHVGHTVCNADGTFTCEGFIGPEPDDQCDGVDQDCNGDVDDEVAVEDPPNACPDTCAMVRFCVNGQMVCEPIVPYEDEKCDGRDNDCDGEIDEGLPTTFFYDGPEGTVSVGECRPGAISCVDGAEHLQPEVTPVPEIPGNNRDDNCDGEVDECQREADAVFVIDRSGSMLDRLTAVADAICGLQYDFNAGEVWGALIVVGDTNSTENVYSDFVPVDMLCDDVQLLNDVGSGVSEYQLDGIALEQDLSWTSDHRIIFTFTDEQMQPDQYQVDDIIDLCVADGFKSDIFTYERFENQWAPITQACLGVYHDLSFDTSMRYQMDQRIRDECQ